MKSYSIQLMSPTLLAPFIQAMDKREMDTERLLTLHGLSRHNIRKDIGMITAKQVHQLLEHIAKASGDPALCWHTGWNLDHRKYPLFIGPLSRGLSLGATLTELSISAENLASATRFELHVSGAYTRLISLRLYKSAPAPHTDAFSAGAMSSLLKRHLKKEWNPAEVSIELADLHCVPVDCGCRLVQSHSPNRSAISFPSGWLIPGAKGFQVSPGDEIELVKAGTLIDFLQAALQAHLPEPDLTAEKAAKWIGSSLREINQSLKPRGVTLAQLIDDWRKNQACQKLQNQDLTIAQTGASVGYPDPTSFSRVFRRWTTMSPRDYRKSVN